ncbi:MAG: WecB/TagA/CpsF family glycosyltransferase [Planctomycetota bacterium]|nr:WecB/TagA/CpsF family glycosyltransferase [Planctomycetota bacterium]
MSNQVQPQLSESLVQSNPVVRNPSYKQSELAEIRAQFALESELNVAALQPVTVDNLYSYENSHSKVSDYLEEVLSSSVIVQPPETTRIWGLDYHAIDMEQTLDHLEKVMAARHPSYVVTANLNYAMLCAHNPRLAAFTQKSALTLCDGMPILWRSKLNATKLPERVAGADLIYRLTERCSHKKLRVYFYGAAEGIAEETAAALKKRYPKLIVAGVQCPPFRACSSEEIRGQIARIKQTKPDLLLVALGQPKGEYWIEDHLEELAVPLTIQLGASFDFVAGNSIRAPRYLQVLGLEWLHRTLKDPVRLAPRYFSNLLFLAKAIRRELIEKLS